jgi:thioredoxin-dependent adenylylsulfate APS reductase
MAETIAPERADVLAAAEIDDLAATFEDRPPEDLLRWAIGRFGTRLALATSLQADGMVVLDLARRIDPAIRVITVDSGRLRQETYDLIDRVRDFYGIAIEVHAPEAADLTAFVGEHGANPFYRSLELRVRCCEIRKVAPLTRALVGTDAWITGQRRDHARTRRAIRKVELDAAHGGIVKLNPLADWTDDRVWSYLRANGVPYNALYDQGYTSIGCAPCTRPTEPGEDPRAGRWWWEGAAPKECDMHCRIDWNSL